MPGKRTLGPSKNKSVRSSREYNAWKLMRARCNNPKLPHYHRYGGRGIRVCERWESFEAFLEDLGWAPSAAHTLDRYPDPDGNYEPGNCRWATRKEQSRNASFNRMLTFQEKTLSIAEWADLVGVKATTISARLRRGWSAEQALAISSSTRLRKRGCANGPTHPVPPENLPP